MMRKQAEQASIPIERFPTSSLIRHLYSQGELSIEQFDKTTELLTVRNQLVHGYQSQNLEKEVVELQKLVSELLELWHPKYNLRPKMSGVNNRLHVDGGGFSPPQGFSRFRRVILSPVVGSDLAPPPVKRGVGRCGLKRNNELANVRNGEK